MCVCVCVYIYIQTYNVYVFIHIYIISKNVTTQEMKRFGGFNFVNKPSIFLIIVKQDAFRDREKDSVRETERQRSCMHGVSLSVASDRSDVRDTHGFFFPSNMGARTDQTCAIEQR